MSAQGAALALDPSTSSPLDPCRITKASNLCYPGVWVNRLSKAVGCSVLSAFCLFPARTRADSLHCESQRQSSGYLAVEERGYELFIETGATGQVQMRLRLTYFNSSSQPMDILSRVALPAHSMLKDLLVRGDHGWVSGKATTTSTIKNAPPQGTWFASLLEDSATPDNIQIAQIIGTKLAPSSYTSIELELSVPVQQRMQTQRLCLPPRMISGPGLLQERRVSIRDHQGKAKTFWIDQEKQKSTNQILRSNDRDCLVWSSKKQEPAALHANFSAYSLGKRNNPFSLTIELGPDKSDLPKNVSVMLDSSSSVQPSTFHRGVKLFSAINKKNEGNTSLWKFSRRAEVMKPKT